MTNSPDARDSQQPSATETGAMSALVPLFRIEPYQFRGENTNLEIERMFNDRNNLKAYVEFEYEAYRAACSDICIPADIIKNVRELGSIFHGVICQGKQGGYDDYMRNKKSYFDFLRSLGKYPEKTIKILESMEQCKRKNTLLMYMDFKDFIQQVKKGHIPIPRVSPKILELWAKRNVAPNDVSFHEQWEIFNQNKHDIFMAIKEQILAQYNATP